MRLAHVPQPLPRPGRPLHEPLGEAARGPGARLAGQVYRIKAPLYDCRSPASRTGALSSLVTGGLLWEARRTDGAHDIATEANLDIDLQQGETGWCYIAGEQEWPVCPSHGASWSSVWGSLGGLPRNLYHSREINDERRYVCRGGGARPVERCVAQNGLPWASATATDDESQSWDGA